MSGRRPGPEHQCRMLLPHTGSASDKNPWGAGKAQGLMACRQSPAPGYKAPGRLLPSELMCSAPPGLASASCLPPYSCTCYDNLPRRPPALPPSVPSRLPCIVPPPQAWHLLPAVQQRAVGPHAALHGAGDAALAARVGVPAGQGHDDVGGGTCRYLRPSFLRLRLGLPSRHRGRLPGPLPVAALVQGTAVYGTVPAYHVPRATLW